MGWHSMRPAQRRLLDVLRDGKVTLSVDGVDWTFFAMTKEDATVGPLRVPRAAFRDYIATAGDRRNAADSDVPAMFDRLFPHHKLGVGRGAIKVGEGTVDTNGRYWEFPVGVLGERE